MIAKPRATAVTAKGRAFLSMWTATWTLSARSTGLWPDVEDIVEVSHALHALGHVVVERREQLLVAEFWAIDVLLLERGLRRLSKRIGSRQMEFTNLSAF